MKKNTIVKFDPQWIKNTLNVRTKLVHEKIIGGDIHTSQFIYLGDLYIRGGKHGNCAVINTETSKVITAFHTDYFVSITADEL